MFCQLQQEAPPQYHLLFEHQNRDYSLIRQLAVQVDSSERLILASEAAHEKRTKTRCA